jgi:phosphatidylinositol alpha-1,6-mannosyltransferase
MKEPLPLLVLTELFLPTKGGTAVWFAEVYRRLGDKEIHIVTADVPGAEDVDAVHPNTVHRLSLKRISWLRPESLVMYWRFLGRALRLALQHRFKAVHAGRVLPEGLVAWLVARIVRIPVVIYAHGEEITTWRQPGKFKVMRFTYRHANKVVANSEFTRDQLLELGVPADRIVIINPGVDVDRFKSGLPCDDLKAAIGLEPHQKLILSVGRLSRRKGFDMVIRTLPDLVQRGLDVQYVLIGVGGERDYLVNIARECGVCERVHMLGHVASEDLPRWYNACDVFAMPNREIDGDTEGFGMVFVEAGACGKTGVAGDSGGTGSAVLQGITGIRVAGGSLEAISDAIASLLSNPALSAKLGCAAQKRVCKDFSWEAVAEKTRSIIVSIAGT